MLCLIHGRLSGVQCHAMPCILGLVLGFAAIIGDLGGIDHQAQLRREGFRAHAAGHRRGAGSDRLPSSSPRRCSSFYLRFVLEQCS